ncbi:hypothetical protein AU156_gp141 [Edwardsiella phage PEi20]|uniref:Uncharacterized protein n=1 Tax=Edwardsiella phage PEi20 TaxID=1608310 RepID=A0A0B6VTP3_9CAUD|nr:hypothetical protein AU156_gp141 [Edwardsiella phage PEi20]BAQ22791.1 conserved hypothetical protein [Edwardsiella phage PEi20]
MKNPKNKAEAMEVIETRIPLVTDAASARKAIEALLEPVDEARAEQLMDKYGISMSRGDYGNGETYYPKGSNASEYYIEYACSCNGYDLDGNGNLTEGVWISSSEMC